MENSNVSIIKDLLENPFSRRDIARKSEIVKFCRLTADITLTQNINIKGKLKDFIYK